MYLAYLAWAMWRESGAVVFATPTQRSLSRVAVRGLPINILNPKLSIFFLAFLPQFVSADGSDAVYQMLTLSGVFMAMSFAVFVGYGVLAHQVRHLVAHAPTAMRVIPRVFSGVFVTLGARLAVAER